MRELKQVRHFEVDHFGEFVKYRRKVMALSQAALARQIEMTQASISRIESGEQVVSLRLAFRIAHLLGCKIQIEEIPPPRAREERE